MALVDLILVILLVAVTTTVDCLLGEVLHVEFRMAPRLSGGEVLNVEFRMTPILSGATSARMECVLEKKRPVLSSIVVPVAAHENFVGLSLSLVDFLAADMTPAIYDALHPQ